MPLYKVNLYCVLEDEIVEAESENEAEEIAIDWVNQILQVTVEEYDPENEE